MAASISLDRRTWLKSAGAALAGLSLAPRLPRAAEPGVAVPAPPSTTPVKLSLNENPFGPAPEAIAAMQAHAAQVFRYPSAEGRALVKAIAAKEGVRPEQIVLGAGSGEVLEAFAAGVGAPGGEVVAAMPTYGQLLQAMERKGVRRVEVPLNAELQHDLEAMAAAITPATQCVYVCNPNNPTGTLVDPDQLKAFLIEAAKTTPVFVDEAYLECADDFSRHTMAGLVRAGHNVTVSRTFSKIYGLAGQRIGYGIVPAETARTLRGAMAGGTNYLALVAAQASLEAVNYQENTRLRIKAGRDALMAVLKQLGCRCAVPQGNFVFFQSGRPITEFRSAMAAAGVIVGRPFPPYLDWCRITIGTPEEMAVAHAALRTVLG